MASKQTWLMLALLAVLVAAEAKYYGGDGLNPFGENSNKTCIAGQCFEVDGHYNDEFFSEYGRMLEEDNDDFEEETRRELRGKKRYISYNAMKANRVPCGRRGRSYYNCNAQRANPYTRGCSVITHCYRFTG